MDDVQRYGLVLNYEQSEQIDIFIRELKTLRATYEANTSNLKDYVAKLMRVSNIVNDLVYAIDHALDSAYELHAHSKSKTEMESIRTRVSNMWDQLMHLMAIDANEINWSRDTCEHSTHISDELRSVLSSIPYRSRFVRHSDKNTVLSIIERPMTRENVLNDMNKSLSDAKTIANNLCIEIYSSASYEKFSTFEGLRDVEDRFDSIMDALVYNLTNDADVDFYGLNQVEHLWLDAKKDYDLYDEFVHDYLSNMIESLESDYDTYFVGEFVSEAIQQSEQR